MTTTVKDAIDILRELPEEKQELIAQAIIDYASQDIADVYPLSEEERGEVRVGLEQANRGEFLSDVKLQAFRNRHRA